MTLDGRSGLVRAQLEKMIPAATLTAIGWPILVLTRAN